MLCCQTGPDNHIQSQAKRKTTESAKKRGAKRKAEESIGKDCIGGRRERRRKDRGKSEGRTDERPD